MPVRALTLLAAAILASAQDTIDIDRPLAPPDADLRSAERRIRDIYKSDYAAGKQGAARFVKKLLRVGEETRDDPAARYVLFREASDIAARVGDADSAFRAIGLLAASFRVDVVKLKRGLLKSLARSARTNAARLTIAREAIALVNHCLARADFDEAKSAFSSAQKYARLVKPAGRWKQGKLWAQHFAGLTASTRRDMDFLRKEAAELEKWIDAIAGDPRNDALESLGRHLCFVEGKWDSGREYLTRARSPLGELLAPGQEVTLVHADLWWELGSKRKDWYRTPYYLEAHAAYRELLPNLTGLDAARNRDRITKRLETAETRLLELKTPRYGGSGGSQFLELSPGAGHLVGLRIQPGGVLHGIQAIWSTSRGTEPGRTFGSHGSTSAVARDGYAVGGLRLRSGNRVDGLSVIFMRRRGGVLDTGDTYESDWIGGKGGADGAVIGGTGKLVIGIYGGSGLDIDSIGLVLAP